MSINLPTSGVTENTPGNILFGAGTIHKGLFYGDHYVPTTDSAPVEGKTYYSPQGTSSGVQYLPFEGESFSASIVYFEKYTGWNIAETVAGATKGGTKLSIKPELKDIEADGVLVKVKELTVKTGETATIETNYTEFTADDIEAAVIGQSEVIDEMNCIAITSKSRIEKDDYIENFAYVGKTLDGEAVIVIFENALCTSGFETEGKNKDSGSYKVTFECYANLENGNHDTLPYVIYYPNRTA